METWKSGRKTIKIKCENCGLSFDKTLSEYNRSEKKGKNHYCSRTCSSEHKRLKPKRCLFCSLEFKPESSEGKFCSQSCSAKYNNPNRKGEKRNFTKKGVGNIIEASKIRFNVDEYYLNPNHCKECNGILEFKIRNRVFCSIDCKRKYDRYNMSKYQIYRQQCRFNFNLKEYPEEFDFTLIEQYGWYSPTNKNNNLNGVSRDHMISVIYGYENNISPEIISHPANCQLLKHTDNISKNRKCSTSIEELTVKIDMWNKKYKEMEG